jgi:hypothetical protein
MCGYFTGIKGGGRIKKSPAPGRLLLRDAVKAKARYQQLLATGFLKDWIVETARVELASRESTKRPSTCLAADWVLSGGVGSVADHPDAQPWISMEQMGHVLHPA